MREGDRFGNYLLKQKIAQGGMAAIFRAERVGAMGISREVCIKCILPAHTGDAEFVRMFIDEARISTGLRHSNIVSVEDFGLSETVPFMCMEWVHGTDASKVLKRVRSRGELLPVDVALFIVGEVLKALEYAHAKTDGAGRWLEIVHRDVSPHNVMVSYSGEVKLTDFGIAKASSRLHQTLGDTIKGKVAYMAPEQATGGTLDLRTDLFAVGVVVYELLTGQRPFEGASQLDGVEKMLTGERLPLRALRREVPAEVERFVDRLLATHADGRFPDAGAARDVLEALPALRTGHRSLQRLLRELYPDEQHSTVLPRFQAPSAPSFDAAPTTTSAPFTVPDGTAPLSSAAFGAPSEGTAPLSAGAFASGPTASIERTQTATRPASTTPQGAQAQGASTPPAAAVVPVAPVAQTAGRSAVWLPVAVLLSLAAAIMVLAAVIWVRGPSGAPTATAATTPATPGGITRDGGGEQPQRPAVPPATAVVPPATAGGTPATVAGAPVEDAGAPVGAADDRGERSAQLTVIAIPWGHITVGTHSAENRGTFRLAPGAHRVTVTQPGLRPRRRTVRLDADETKTVRINMQ